jgi:hypothetical protein
MSGCASFIPLPNYFFPIFLMLDVDHITLRDLFKQVLAKEKLTAQEAAELMDTGVHNVYNFMAGRVTSPYSEVFTKIEEFLMDNGVTRSSILKQMTPKQKKQYTHKGYPELKKAIEFLKQHLKDNPTISRTQLAKEIGLANPTALAPSGLNKMEGKAMTDNMKALLAWYQKRTGTAEQEARKEIFGSAAAAKAAEGIEQQFEMTSQKEGKHYVCAFLDDWEMANAIGAVTSSAMTEQQKKTMLHKLFPSQFPTLQ